MSNYKIYGQHDENTLKQFEAVMQEAVAGALQADGHLGYVMPIGGVALYDNKVSIAGVGYDIACGNKAIKLDIKYSEMGGQDLVRHILDVVQKNVSFGIGTHNDKSPKDDKIFSDDRWKVYPVDVQKDLIKLAREQCGTVGGGNHYVDIFVDENDFIWIGVHFGSRGLGHKTASGFMALNTAGQWSAKANENVDILLGLDTWLGQSYYQAMSLCGEYAYLGRNWVCKMIADEIQADVIDEVHNHHNFAWKENHLGKDYIVIRKGATPCWPGQRGFIGGSMGDNAYIVEGIDSQNSKDNFYSTVHGAGRVMSRTQAKGKFKGRGKYAKRKTEGRISRAMLDKWMTEKGVILIGGDVDESPHVYRRLDEVLQNYTVNLKILHTLVPKGVVMAGSDINDPYKD
jgi:tRNA-splicing ligase RtcB